MKNPILLIGGAVLTLLFIVFPAAIFEMVDGHSEFANEMYNENFYFVVAIVSAAIAWGTAALFYYAINSVSFSRWYHWLLCLGVAALVAPVANYMYLDGALSIDYNSQLISFCIVDFVTTAILYIVASFAIRWWSSNCRHTPIPE